MLLIKWYCIMLAGMYGGTALLCCTLITGDCSRIKFKEVQQREMMNKDLNRAQVDLATRPSK